MSVPESPSILFVDDEATAVKYFQRAIASLAPVAAAHSVEEGKALLDRHAKTLLVVVSDQRMPGGCGNELLTYARSRYPHMVRILTTAYSELEQTIEAVNQGQIHRYLQKPWEIASLRMEVKQALSLGVLQKEHAQLLREKMTVRQNETVASRIGTLYALAIALGCERFSALENYLLAAKEAGANPPAPDWLAMDYSDLVSAEAERSGAFGRAVKEKLTELAARPKSDAEALVAEFADSGSFAEFLAGPTESPVSSAHAAWLALLLWLARHGLSLERSNGSPAIVEAADAPQRLAVWIEQFCQS